MTIGAAVDDRTRLDATTASLEPPFALIDLDSFWPNADDLVRRAAGKPIRVASKSVRCRELQSRVLERSGFRGTLCFTLPEALWLTSCGHDDLVVAYPTSDRTSVAELARTVEERPSLRVSLMVDSVEHLDLIATANRSRAQIDVCIDIDAGWWALGGLVKVEVKRSPIRTPAQAAALAVEIASSCDEPPGHRSFRADISRYA